MNSQRFAPLSKPSLPFLRLAIGALCMTGGISILAFADGPIQPDPPVPLEGPARLIAAADREPDCRCGVLHARDIESRVAGHVERWESLRAPAPAGRTTPRQRRSEGLHPTTFAEGVVGFPMRQFRLAADTPGDDGAGSD